MGEDLILLRNRFIQRLFEQISVRVDGPCFDDPNRMLYRVWRGTGTNRSAPWLRIEFHRRFLSEPDNNFARFTFQALQKAREILRDRSGAMDDQGEIRVSNEGVRFG